MHHRAIRLLGVVSVLCAIVLALGWGTLAAQAAAGSEHPQQTAVTSDPAPTDNGGDDDNGDVIKRYGLVESLPASGLTGTWVISGSTYSADETTRFEMEHGGFAVDVCVKVVVRTATPDLALKIESESAYKCDADSGDDDGDHDGDHDRDHDYDSKLFGTIVSLPAGPEFLGAWVVGSETFTVTADTKLEQEDAPFAVGTFVKVEFKEVDGVKIATSVESKFEMDCDDDDCDGDEDRWHRGHDGRAFGPIEALPDGLIGTWVIAGLNYSVTTATDLHNSSAYTVGVNVKVEYYTNDAGERVATEIKRTGNHNGGEGPGVFKFVGWVSEKPSGFIGVWIIGGERFTATEATRFDEREGLLTSTAYVEATYRIASDQRLLLKLEARVAPGAGDDDSIGQVESMPSDDSLWAAGATADIWRVGGVDYVVTPATQILSSDALLEVGSTVAVNSFVDASGATTATRIEAIALDYQVLLPLLRR
jgi:hypothetical protein